MVKNQKNMNYLSNESNENLIDEINNSSIKDELMRTVKKSIILGVLASSIIITIIEKSTKNTNAYDSSIYKTNKNKFIFEDVSHEYDQEYDKYLDNFVSIHAEEVINNPYSRMERVCNKYNMTLDELKTIIGIVIAEAKKGDYVDGYAVTSVLWNRTHNIRWVNSFGDTLYEQATASGQFVVFEEGHYKSFIDTTEGEVFDAIMDCLETEDVMHNYLSFRGKQSDYGVAFVEGGNKYFEEFLEEERIIEEEELKLQLGK